LTFETAESTPKTMMPNTTFVFLRELAMKKGHQGEEPTFWPGKNRQGKDSFLCNVEGISWCSKRCKWQVQTQDSEGKPNVKVQNNFDEAVAYLRSLPPNGKCGPGDLVSHNNELVVSKCSHRSCKRVNLAAMEFCPHPSMCKAKAHEYCSALINIQNNPYDDNTEHFDTIRKLKRAACFGCRERMNRSNSDGPNSARAKCERAVKEIRADMASRGCAKCGIKECLECDHEGRVDKERCVIDAPYWAEKYMHEGVKMMWAEYRKPCIQVLCKNCHVMQPTHSAAWSKATTHGRVAASAYNKSRKRDVGKCFYCDEKCVEGNERMFAWCHIDDEKKKLSVTDIVGKGLKLDDSVPMIDATIDGGEAKSGRFKGEYQGSGCRLCCHNCHHKYETIPRMQQCIDLYDRLKGIPIKCAAVPPIVRVAKRPFDQMS
jgi:hypothetical protein